jgi:hypothetical protein
MTTSTKRKLDGMISLVWVCLGFWTLKYADCHANSVALTFFIVFGAWWGVGLLLAISGLKSGSRVSALASALTILWFFYFLQSLFPRIHG